jgi:hypothetical protein
MEQSCSPMLCAFGSLLRFFYGFSDCFSDGFFDGFSNGFSDGFFDGFSDGFSDVFFDDFSISILISK